MILTLYIITCLRRSRDGFAGLYLLASDALVLLCSCSCCIFVSLLFFLFSAVRRMEKSSLRYARDTFRAISTKARSHSPSDSSPSSIGNSRASYMTAVGKADTSPQSPSAPNAVKPVPQTSSTSPSSPTAAFETPFYSSNTALPESVRDK